MQPPVRRFIHDAGVNLNALTAIEVPTVFRNFDDYWRPFTLGAGPAPDYRMNLAPRRASGCASACTTACRARQTAASC